MPVGHGGWAGAIVEHTALSFGAANIVVGLAVLALAAGALGARTPA